MPLLREYSRKRRFDATPEPKPGLQPVRQTKRRAFCVQLHRATRLHYDLRLEMGGVLKSWAVPKGPTLDPEVRRLAMETEDHPLDYLKFEGVIPEGNYGAGEVVVWDIGTYEVAGNEPPLKQLERGSLKFILKGKKLRGAFALARMAADPDGKSKPWLLIKKHDDDAVFGDQAARHPGSVLSGLRITSLQSKDPAPFAARARATATPARSAAARRSPALRSAPLRSPARNARRAQGDRKPKPASAPARAALPAQPAQHRGRQRAPAAAATDALQLPGAVAGPLPRGVHPMLATLVAKPFTSPEWLFEIKWDGVRALAYRRDGRLTLVSRNGNDVTQVYPELAELQGALPDGAGDFLLDGEIVTLDAQGRSSFARLQRRMNLAQTREIARAQNQWPVIYYAFDVLHAGGAALFRTPLARRKQWLKENLATGPHVRFSDHVAADGSALFALAREQELEGILAKRLDSAYEQRRSRQWLKIKIHQQQEAVVIGYTDPQGSRDYFGALLLALYDPKRRQFYPVGRVGTGFDRATRRQILAQLRALPAGDAGVKGTRQRPGVHLVPPQLIAEVRFAEWTPDGNMRAPSFLGLRTDKLPTECVRESPRPAADGKG